MTRIKIAAIVLVIVAGAIVIAVAQWPVAVKAVGESQGIASAVLLEVVVAGIPIIAWGLAAYFALAWLLLKRGELDAYKAQREIASLPPPTGKTAAPPEREMLD